MAILKYVIADDHKIFRQGLKMVLNDDYRIQCAGEAATGTELLALLRTVRADVVLLDLNMPDLDGIQALSSIRIEYPELRVIILTMQNDEKMVLHLMELGANGYLVKSADPAEIKKALHTVCESGYYFNDLVSTVLLRKVSLPQKTAPQFNTAIQLTERELQVLTLICAEKTTAEIGAAIYLSPRTVEGIRASLLEKIGVRNTAGLVLYAVKQGIVN